jgi:hypothetical protein
MFSLRYPTLRYIVFLVLVHFVAYLLLHLGKPIKAGQANQNDKHSQMETYPTTEEPRPRSSSSSEDHRSAHKVP